MEVEVLLVGKHLLQLLLLLTERLLVRGRLSLEALPQVGDREPVLALPQLVVLLLQLVRLVQLVLVHLPPVPC